MSYFGPNFMRGWWFLVVLAAIGAVALVFALGLGITWLFNHVRFV